MRNVVTAHRILFLTVSTGPCFLLPLACPLLTCSASDSLFACDVQSKDSFYVKHPHVPSQDDCPVGPFDEVQLQIALNLVWRIQSVVLYRVLWNANSSWWDRYIRERFEDNTKFTQFTNVWFLLRETRDERSKLHPAKPSLVGYTKHTHAPPSNICASPPPQFQDRSRAATLLALASRCKL